MFFRPHGSCATTQESAEQVASAAGRGSGSFGFNAARIEATRDSFAVRHYLTADESADLELTKAIYHAKQNHIHGAGRDRREVKLLHVWHNIEAWLKNRDRDFSFACQLIGGAGWWRRQISGQKDLSELAALIRCLHHVSIGPDSDESPFADADNGQLAYDGN